jgi:hypothetical protein
MVLTSLVWYRVGRNSDFSQILPLAFLVREGGWGGCPGGAALKKGRVSS